MTSKKFDSQIPNRIETKKGANRDYEFLNKQGEGWTRCFIDQREAKTWLSVLAQQYVKAIENATLDDSYPWLQELAQRTNDPAEKEKIISVSQGRYVHGDWSEAIAKARALKIKKVRSTTVSVRGLDHDLYTEARSRAIREGKNIGEWFNEAIKEKLSKK